MLGAFCLGSVTHVNTKLITLEEMISTIRLQPEQVPSLVSCLPFSWTQEWTQIKKLITLITIIPYHTLGGSTETSLNSQTSKAAYATFQEWMFVKKWKKLNSSFYLADILQTLLLHLVQSLLRLAPRHRQLHHHHHLQKQAINILQQNCKFSDWW